jgi:hypothetical protein
VRGPTLNAEDEDEEVDGTANGAAVVTVAARISSPDSCAPPGMENPNGARGGGETTRHRRPANSGGEGRVGAV